MRMVRSCTLLGVDLIGARNVRASRRKFRPANSR